MPTTAVVFTALAATVGVIMATMHWREKRPSLAFAVIQKLFIAGHGLIAASAFVLLLLAVIG